MKRDTQDYSRRSSKAQPGEAFNNAQEKQPSERRNLSRQASGFISTPTLNVTEQIPSPSNILPSAGMPIGSSSHPPNVPHSLKSNGIQPPLEARYVQKQARRRSQDAAPVQRASIPIANLPALTLDQAPRQCFNDKSDCFSYIYRQRHDYDSFSIHNHTPPMAASTHEQQLEQEDRDAVQLLYDGDVLLRGHLNSEKDDEARWICTAADPAYTRVRWKPKSSRLHDASEGKEATEESVAENENGVLGLIDSEALAAQVQRSRIGNENESAKPKETDGPYIDQMAQIPAKPIPFYPSKEMAVNDRSPAQSSASSLTKEVGAQGLRQSRSDRDQLTSQRRFRGEFGASLEDINAWNRNAKDLRRNKADAVKSFTVLEPLGQRNATETPAITQQDTDEQAKLKRSHAADTGSPHRATPPDCPSVDSTLTEHCPSCNHSIHDFSSTSSRRTCTGICRACNRFIPIRITALEALRHKGY